MNDVCTSETIALQVPDKTCEDRDGFARKSDKKTVLDLAAWNFSITSSVGIIMVNKVLNMDSVLVRLCFIEYL
jgi:hypothetical protein